MKLKYTYYFGDKAEYYNVYEVWIGKEVAGFCWFCFGVEELDTQMLADLDDYCRIYEELYEKLEED